MIKDEIDNIYPTVYRGDENYNIHRFYLIKETKTHYFITQYGSIKRVEKGLPPETRPVILDKVEAYLTMLTKRAEDGKDITAYLNREDMEEVKSIIKESYSSLLIIFLINIIVLPIIGVPII